MLGVRSRLLGLRLPSVELQVGAADGVLLEPLTEEEIATNLLLRFQHDHIYTYVGNVLISVNPYKPLTLYAADVIETYKTRAVFELPPHVYALADCAWRQLQNLHRDQVIIITGESGAGKTEAAKLILQYIAAVSSSAPLTLSSQMRNLETLHQQLLLVNPLLEAFGNAKTRRNDNASRFGKYIDVEFDYKGAPVGVVVTNYLLEKSRVTMPSVRGERNFHIFFQLLAGADVQLLKSLKLQRNVGNYQLLRDDVGDSNVDSTDREDFQITKRALETLGFSAEDVTGLFRIVAAVLKMGNLSFHSVTNMDGTQSCSIANDYELEEVAMLLAMPTDELHNLLLYRSVDISGPPTASMATNGLGSGVATPREPSLKRTSPSRAFTTILLSDSPSLCGKDLYDSVEVYGGSSRSVKGADAVMVDLNAVEAAEGRDILCRTLYHRLFTWLVHGINNKIKVKQPGKRKMLGLLDLYGFEDGDGNGFEQLLINFSNERVHQVLIELTFKEEQQEYVQEGLEWTSVAFSDNLIICDLIRKGNHGILSVLDDVCLRSSQTAKDRTLLDLLDETFQDHAHYDVLSPLEAFRLKHYAGPVTYETAGFIEKNSDSLCRDLSQAMYRCGHPILKSLFPEGNPKKTMLRRPATTSNQFQTSMEQLTKQLTSKMAHHLCCLKPNESKQPNVFEIARVRHQVHYLNLAGLSRIRRAGFIFRQTYSAFLQRFKMTSSLTWPHWCGPAIEGVARLLRHLPVAATEYAFGRTKIFIKNASTMAILEELRQNRIEELATLIQKTFRCWRARRGYERVRRAQSVIALAWRHYKARKEGKERRYRRRIEWAVKIIERFFITTTRRRYLIRLANRLPSSSPLGRDWPTVSPILQNTNQLLRKVFHQWRCHRYRLQFDQIGRNRMREKVTASFLFRNRKESYRRSVAHPFQGDYVRLRQNSQWRRLVADTVDHYVVFADIVSKISRSSGRLVPVLFAVTTGSILLLDQRTLHIKYRVPAADVMRISLSPYLDDLAVFHVRSLGSAMDAHSVQNLPGCLFQAEASGSSSAAAGGAAASANLRKGDLVLQTCHVIELVTKTFLVVQNAASKAPEVNISADFEANFGHQLVDFCFRCVGLPEVQPGQIRIVRRGPRMEVFL